MNKGTRIAVDGPSGAGKSTIAKAVADRLGYEYIDTGAMYRAVAYGMVRDGITCEESDRERLASFLGDATVDFREGHVCLNGEDIADRIRTPEISMMASDCSAIGIVREKLVAEQRLMGETKNVILDGRDIGTQVFPDAEFKFYLTADAAERARRRLADLEAAYEKKKADLKAEGLKGKKLKSLLGPAPVFEDVLRDIEQRDWNDMHRDISPLVQAEDAVLIDSTHSTIEETVQAFLDVILRASDDAAAQPCCCGGCGCDCAPENAPGTDKEAAE
jgi:cytidylate kinase